MIIPRLPSSQTRPLFPFACHPRYGLSEVVIFDLRPTWVPRLRVCRTMSNWSLEWLVFVKFDIRVLFLSLPYAIDVLCRNGLTVETRFFLRYRCLRGPMVRVRAVRARWSWGTWDGVIVVRNLLLLALSCCLSQPYLFLGLMVRKVRSHGTNHDPRRRRNPKTQK
jgi:hypothetical protein